MIFEARFIVVLIASCIGEVKRSISILAEFFLLGWSDNEHLRPACVCSLKRKVRQRKDEQARDEPFLEFGTHGLGYQATWSIVWIGYTPLLWEVD